MKPHLNNKNDVNWCMQFIAPILGAIFLFMGSIMTEGFWSNVREYYLIYLGILWIILGFVHRIKWLHKLELHQVLNQKDT